ncbi:DNA topoisomerase i [Cyclospora cayetanensis]|uniref:DNA topoisomerase 1 n=1 Tax=Cyclospora cayetanensis TaxID=88456 RepID=A0A1D3D3J6_9EIME|nr:DNA topoisomerase i [Cyclospora cayetanensis]
MAADYHPRCTGVQLLSLLPHCSPVFSGSDSSDEDTLPLGAKRFKQCKVEPEAAVAISAAGAAEGGESAKVENGDSKFLVKEAVSCSSSTTTTTGSCSTNGRADDSAGAAQGSTARGVAVKGSLAAALSNVKTDVKDGEMPKAAAAGTATGISRPSASPSPVGARRRNKYTKTEENFEPISRWWEKDLSQLENNVVQWQYLEHNGMIFAPPYEPHGIGIKYKGQEVSLPPEAEEVANFWSVRFKFRGKVTFSEKAGGVVSHNAHAQDLANSLCLLQAPAARLISDEASWLVVVPQALKAQKDAEAAPFAFALVDWLREKVGNCKAEPPGLFRGRGEHPKQGMLKRRIFPEDVILNLGEDAPVPRAPDMPGHCWKDIAHDCRVTWLAFYRDSINDQVKYMYLAAQSGFKGQQDFLKYEKARRLKHYVVKIREDYYKKMRSADPLDRQLGTATYLIDFLALRVGGEKDTDEEADTVGCCSLRVEHTTLNSETEEVTFDFLGKDSIRYFNTVKIDSQAFKNLSTSLNNHLKQLMPGLSAKMFRTYNASITLQQELQKLQPTLRKFKEEVETEHQKKMSKVKGKKTVKAEQEAAVAVAAAVATTTSDDDEDVPLGCISAKKEKKVAVCTTTKEPAEREGPATNETPVLDVNLSDVNQLVQFYNDANRAVAILCNHQRSVPKQHAASMARLEHQLQAIEEDLRELKAFQQHLKKNKGAAKGFKFHSDFVSLKGEPRKSVVRDGMREEAVTKKIAQVEYVLAMPASAVGKKKQSHLVRMRMKDDNKTVALGTSKINYMDPRITVAFCKQYELPIEKVFNKSLRLKFPWAMFAPSNFIF